MTVSGGLVKIFSLHNFQIILPFHVHFQETLSHVKVMQYARPNLLFSILAAGGFLFFRFLICDAITADNSELYYHYFCDN